MFDKLVVDREIDLRTIGRSSLAQCEDFYDECGQFDPSSGANSLTPRDADLLFAFTAQVSESFEVAVVAEMEEDTLVKDEAEACFDGFIAHVREAMDQFDIPLRKDISLIAALDKLLHFDVDVTVARHAHKRLLEEMEADE